MLQKPMRLLWKDNCIYFLFLINHHINLTKQHWIKLAGPIDKSVIIYSTVVTIERCENVRLTPEKEMKRNLCDFELQMPIDTSWNQISLLFVILPLKGIKWTVQKSCGKVWFLTAITVNILFFCNAKETLYIRIMHFDQSLDDKRYS